LAASASSVKPNIPSLSGVLASDITDDGGAVRPGEGLLLVGLFEEKIAEGDTQQLLKQASKAVMHSSTRSKFTLG